jgi:hypothetical protein
MLQNMMMNTDLPWGKKEMKGKENEESRKKLMGKERKKDGLQR